MVVKVGINGFGRIGRLALRRIEEVEGVEVTHINDLTSPEMLAHLLRFDSTQGRFNGELELAEGGFKVNGRFIKVTAERDPEKISWADSGVEIVLEATGFFATKAGAEKHLHVGGAKKVLITAPGGSDVKTIVFNVNHDTLDGTETVISAGSCTTNSLAPMAKVLNDNWGIRVGEMTTIHSYTGEQMLLDGPHHKGNLRRARSAGINIVPTTSGAANAIGLVIPEIDGKLKGHAQRVPTAAGSVTELTTILEKKASVDEINAAMKKAATDSFAYNDYEIVSTDIIGDTHGSVFDATQTEIVDAGDIQMVKTVAWYDNEMSFTAQLIRTLAYFAKIAK
ncbi:MAG: type I glyceraldehyde-3-phosphate dehydrogenase [Streptococcaceae bacterium]|jgi:glyceraldehyde 3-phosphate dehydrogenase|nr:type I glyceraldehyde-3-phosphate dehydrogenase [Streptococcaceae bacterium]